jgi:2-oxoisovalerate dehydrogenase E1 component alpha subunit
VSIDGMDVLGMREAVAAAAARARQGEGPTLIEAKVERMTPHSSDDDDRTYRPRDEVEAMKKRDPLLRYRSELRQRTVLTEKADEEYEARAKQAVEEAVSFAAEAPYPEVETATFPVYAEDIPTPPEGAGGRG